MVTQPKAGGAPPETDLEMLYPFSMSGWLFQDKSPDDHPGYTYHIRSTLNAVLLTSQEPWLGHHM